MPLTEPADREPIHTRRIDCRGYRRSDGLWDIEGHLVDTKSYAFSSRDRGAIHPGEALHEMWLRLTVDDTLTIRRVEAVADNSPFALCPDIAPDYAQLAGLRIKGGFTAAVKARLGGVAGCTHLTELLGPLATTAFQTIVPWLAHRERLRAGDVSSEGVPPLSAVASGSKPPPLIDSCHAFASDGPVVRREWPTFYTGPGYTGPDAPDPAAPDRG